MGILAICSKSSRFFFPLHQVNFYLSLMPVLFAVSLTNNSVQFSHSVVSNSLRPHELQHTRPHCSSPSPGVHSDSLPSSLWCRPAISSSVVPFSSRLQSCPASGSFQMSQFFASGGPSSYIHNFSELRLPHLRHRGIYLPGMFQRLWDRIWLICKFVTIC